MPTFLPAELEPFARLMEKEEPKALVIVGAGVSIGATSAPQASWLGLLRHGVDHLVATKSFTEEHGRKLKASLEAAFSPFDLASALSHAELVEQNLLVPDDSAFEDWLACAFRDLEASEAGNATLTALRDLQQHGALLLTTNYDGLLSQATGLPPVTWEEHEDFLAVVNRKKAGILHIHGHWQRPSSVVLGRSSYERIVGDQYLQAAFKSLWLEWSWLYVGCGDGLDDPNLGRLLAWGRPWGSGARPHYFLARSAQALALARRSDKPPNLVSVGYADHRELPDILRGIAPAARSWPFVLVDAGFALFRSPGSTLTVPFPSRQEYLDGEVPSLAADVEVRRRLDEHGWAFVLDVASVGKTTLALRLATAPEQRDHPTFYLDLAKSLDDAETEAKASAVLTRLLRPETLLVLDNVHHHPELARSLWEQWRELPRRSRLLIVATRMERQVTTSPEQDLSFFERHASNPAVELKPVPDDLGRIVQHVYRRVAGRAAAELSAPPPEAVERWHRDYGHALGAFCLAVLGHLAEFRRGRWELPIEAAADWVRAKWLDQLDAENRENALCLAVFGTLEMTVQERALPRPGKIERLLRLGLIERMQRGPLGQYRRYRLREPSWGRLILAAQVSPIAEEAVLFAAAAQDLILAVVLAAQLRRQGLTERALRLWSHLASQPGKVVALSADLPLSYFPILVLGAATGGQPQLATRLWEAIESEPSQFAVRAWETSLNFVVSFLETAKRQGRDTGPLWEALEREPDQLAARAWETSLHPLGSFLETARRHGRDTRPLWEALEREPARLVARAWETSLNFMASFLEIALRQGRDTGPLWEALEREPGQFAAHGWETSLQSVGSFFESARRQGRDTRPLWEALEREPARLATRALETPLNSVASFLETAKRQGRDTGPLWEMLEGEPARFAARAWGTPLNFVASFLETAERQGRDTGPLWETLEHELDRLIARLWETPLHDVGSFLETANRQGRDTGPLWEALEHELDRLIARLWETPLHDVGSFLETANRQGHDTSRLWEALEREPSKLSTWLWETPLHEIGSFLETANHQERDTGPLWEALEREPDRLVARLWETPLHDVGSFLEAAKHQERDTGWLWEALESEPDRVAQRAHGIALESVVGFMNQAQEQGRKTEPLWEALERDPGWLFARRAVPSVAQLTTLCRYAPLSVVRLVLGGLEVDHWDRIPSSESLGSATWVAARSAEAGREDLRDALATAIFRRASPQDFPIYGRVLAKIAWWLGNRPPATDPLVARFLAALGTPRRLHAMYTNTGCGALATGLRMLAFEQPPSILSRFQYASLGDRLESELFGFPDVDLQEQSGILQLVGCAALAGRVVPSEWFQEVPVSALGSLATEALPHRAEAEKVEWPPLQLWLGLRATASATGTPIGVLPVVLRRTLDLWRMNLAESSAAPASVAHRVHVSMVAWLERCSRGDADSLLPESEGLWELTWARD